MSNAPFIFYSTAAVVYNLAKTTMYIIFLFRIHMIYYKSKYGYNPKLLIIWAIFMIITQISIGIYGTITFIEIPYSTEMNGKTYNTYNAVLNPMYVLMLLATDIFESIALLLAFIIPLAKILKSLKQYDSGKDLQDIKFPAIKVTSLTVIVLVSSLLAHVINFFSQSVTIYTFDIPLNAFCIMLTAPYYNELYRKLCCGVIKCFECCESSNEENIKLQNIMNSGKDITNVDDTEFETRTAKDDLNQIKYRDQSEYTQTNVTNI